MGSYDCVFTVLKDVYGARTELGIGVDSPFPTWRDALHRIDSTVLSDHGQADGRRWVDWQIVFPRNASEPGSGGPAPVAESLKCILGAGLQAFLGSPHERDIGPLRRLLLAPFFTDTPVESSVSAAAAAAEEKALAAVHRYVDRFAMTDGGDPPRFLAPIIFFLEAVLGQLDRVAVEEPSRLKRDVALLEFALTVLRGMLADVWCAESGSWEFGRIDHLDLRAWLRLNGASSRCVDSSLVRFLYAGTFSNLCDGTGEGGLFAAGTALRAIFKMLSYKGSLVWQPRAGTGDTLIAPMVEVLRARGVRFEFFHRASRVHDSRTDTVERVDFIRQAEVTGPRYEPLTSVACEGGVVQSWPNEPLWGQLRDEDVERIKSVGHHCDCSAVGGSKVTLLRGRDFDHVILATPVGTIRGLCPGMVERLPSWRSTVDSVGTTPTQSFQLWFLRDNRALGLPIDEWGVADADVPNAITYANGFSAWGDATATLSYESWPEGQRARAVSHFCGAFFDEREFDATDPLAHSLATNEVRARAEQWSVDNMGWIFRSATTFEDPFGLDRSLLAVPRPDGAESHGDRWRAQFFGANIAPSDRYTLTLPGSIEARMRFDETGFANLLVCGDWVGHDGINAGFVDGSMFCGVQAARAARVRIGCDNPDPLPLDPDFLSLLTRPRT